MFHIYNVLGNCSYIGSNSGHHWSIPGHWLPSPLYTLYLSPIKDAMVVVWFLKAAEVKGAAKAAEIMLKAAKTVVVNCIFSGLVEIVGNR